GYQREDDEGDGEDELIWDARDVLHGAVEAGLLVGERGRIGEAARGGPLADHALEQEPVGEHEQVDDQEVEGDAAEEARQRLDLERATRWRRLGDADDEHGDEEDDGGGADEA